MPRERTIQGTMTQGDDPFWDPLLAAVGGRHACWFMWMYEVELADDTFLQAYKHVSTRRYLHLGDDGRAYSYIGDELYREIEPELAIDLALVGWRPEEEEVEHEEPP